MKTYTHLWQRLCSFENLERAFRRAQRRKTKKSYVQEFEKNLENNLEQLRAKLLFHTYKPRLLKTFIVRDPKTRKISKSDFRDRVMHHALYNVIDLMFEKQSIHDSFANQKGKGTLKAVQRFDEFKRKIYNKYTKGGYVLKADIKHYFNEIDHTILLTILKRKIKDAKIISLQQQFLLLVWLQLWHQVLQLQISHR